MTKVNQKSRSTWTLGLYQFLPNVGISMSVAGARESKEIKSVCNKESKGTDVRLLL